MAKSPRHSTVGLKAIAAACEVSINTVSRALRDCSDISKATKNRVRAKAVELGYVPNRIAAALKSGNTKMVCLIFNNLKSPYFCVMADRIVYLLRQRGYNSLIVPNFSTACTKENVQEALVARTDGIITFLEPTEEAALVAKLNTMPMVLVGRSTPFEGIDQIYTDDVKGGALAAQYLMDKGCKRLLYISANAVECSLRRYRGFREKALAGTWDVTVDIISESDLEKDFDDIIQSGYDGVFCFNEQLALFFIELMKKAGVRQGITVVSYDGLANQMIHSPKIPCISYDFEAIADRAFNILMTRIDESERSQDEHVVYDVKLINGNEVENFA